MTLDVFKVGVKNTKCFRFSLTKFDLLVPFLITIYLFLLLYNMRPDPLERFCVDVLRKRKNETSYNLHTIE